MKRYLITGVSSGIGRELTKELIKRGDRVWGIARRTRLLISLKKELGETKSFRYSALDIIRPKSWTKVVDQMRSVRFSPQIIVFNAAIFSNDFSPEGNIDVSSTRKIIETNFFSILTGLNELFKFVKPKTKFIFIGSSSAFKGGGEEGIGYCVSKAAISQTMESLHLKHKSRYNFKIIHFGPVTTDMLPLRNGIHFVISASQAARHIIESIHSHRHIFHYPGRLFFFLRFIKILPTSIYLRILSTIDALHKKNKK